MSQAEKFRLSEASLALLREKAAAYGTQQKLADAAGMPKPTLQKLLSGDADPAFSRVAAVARVLELSLDRIATAEEWPGNYTPIGQQITAIFEDDSKNRMHSMRKAFAGQGLSSQIEIAISKGLSDNSPAVQIPALSVQASAGDGSIATDERLLPGPFHFAGDWLRKTFGAISGLKLVQVKGDSQEPDMHGGDWVLIDEARNEVENGLAVVRLDDCLMIKWLQREGHMLRLISRNPQYLPTVLDLRKDEDRVKVIGRAVFMLKAL